MRLPITLGVTGFLGNIYFKKLVSRHPRFCLIKNIALLNKYAYNNRNKKFFFKTIIDSLNEELAQMTLK